MFKQLFPEFASRDDDDVQDVIDDALDVHQNSPRATLYCAAHFLVIDDEERRDEHGDAQAGEYDQGDGALVTNESVVGKSLGYALMTDAGDRDSFFERTPYGRRFLVLEDRSPAFTFPILVR